MEKVNFKNSRKLNLVGDFYNSNSKSIIIMCHGFRGDRHEWGKFDKIAKELNESGFNILNFDFSGSGESDDDSISVEKEVDDLKSAIGFVKRKRIELIGLFGHSLGGFVCLKNYNHDIKAMVLTAPVTDKKENYANKKKFSEEELAELKQKGTTTKIRTEKGLARKKIVVDKKIIEERESINQEQVLSRVKCPVLIIHGNKDEDVPLEDSKKALNYLPDNSKLEIIENEDHDFKKNLDKVIGLAKGWFREKLG